MIRAGWTVMDLAGSLEVDRSTMSRYLKGKSDVPARLLIDAWRFLDVDPTSFVRAVDRVSDAVINELAEDAGL